ncbi:MAG: CRISPR system precrRNA processing endoribonuclease RAMP protein Cas6 [Thermofilaceae archaeon]
MPASIYAFTVDLVPLKQFVVTAWSGSFAVRVLYDVLKRRGVEFSKRERKPFVAEPPLLEGRYLLSGFHTGLNGRPHPRFGWRVVEAGQQLKFRYHFLDEVLAKVFIDSLVSEPVIDEPATRLELASVSFEQVEAPKPSPPLSRVVAKSLEFAAPTCYQFYGYNVLYPSPVRTLVSALKKYASVSGVDTRPVVERVHKAVELAGTPRVERVYVDIGEGRIVPAFMGRATIALRGDEDLPVLLAALKLAERLGVGVSTSIGFGRIRVVEGQQEESVKEVEGQEE